MVKGVIYLVSTPIGNLEDITLRAIRILGEVDYVFAEDTRSALKLLNHYGIKKKIISFFEGNKYEREILIKEVLAKGMSVAIISEAGTPGISDPGGSLIKMAIEENYPLEFIPGPTAIIASLITSGLSTQRFIFMNFAPRKKSDRIELFESIIGLEATSIFFESKRRVSAFLQDAIVVFGENHKVVVARELTKKFEEFIRGSLREVLQIITDRKEVLGEVVILLEGTKTKKIITENLINEINALIPKYPLKTACKMIAREKGYKANDLYQRYLKGIND